MSAAEIQRARTRAKRLWPRSKALQATYVRGAVAASAGRAADSCPYRLKQGWGTSWRRAWLAGFQSIAPSD